jgi:hypothetical protein
LLGIFLIFLNRAAWGVSVVSPNQKCVLEIFNWLFTLGQFFIKNVALFLKFIREKAIKMVKKLSQGNRIAYTMSKWLCDDVLK